ncbi:MAG TPA: hypothetical protein VF742_12590, partial [Terracidiphilus sp.]
MIDALKPMHLGEILDHTVQIYRRQFLLFVGIAAPPSMVVLACFAAGFLLYGAATNGASPRQVLAILGILAITLVGLLLYVVACAFGYAALSLAARKRFFGEAITIRGMYREAWPHGWRYLGLYALEFLILGVAPFTVMFLAILVDGIFSRTIGGSGAATAGAIGFMIVVLLLGGYILWMLPRLSMAFAASVAEDAGVWQSIQRSWTLSKGTCWRILLLFLLGAVCGWMLTWLVTIPALIVVSMIPGMSSPQHQGLMGEIILFAMYGAGFVVQALVRPVYGIALVLFYY